MKKTTKKTTRPNTTNSEPAWRRRLELARDTVRTLAADDLAHAAGGSACDSTSWTSKH
ncbi:MAG TPA: hypothetical protein VHW23_15580 [Kofleriaceae bacterium]|jgi:hypothetical protein|nr:hypothetical protein [Kofleriaceae bacterium]